MSLVPMPHYAKAMWGTLRMMVCLACGYAT